MAEALFQKAIQPKCLYIRPVTGHNYMIDIGGKTLEDRIGAFIQSLRRNLQPAAPAP